MLIIPLGRVMGALFNPDRSRKLENFYAQESLLHHDPKTLHAQNLASPKRPNGDKNHFGDQFSKSTAAVSSNFGGLDSEHSPQLSDLVALDRIVEQIST